ncbi:hypothetical protein [uncultured Thomasclavelia sp.]|uniref:hypothetical protein n=1 Tax=uncultured Thomasclavelia sp. TaxID=3025759 RepID=UPI00260A78DA|nr:hypothetical protein [uncultured Thomasclavelia sp.]
MKNAWRIIRKWNKSLKVALKMAWAMAKKERQVREQYNIDDCYSFEFNLWSGYGKTRAYYKTGGMSKNWNNNKAHFVELSNI